MLRVILVDDEERARSNLRNLLEQYCPEVKVVGGFDSPQKVISYVEEYPVDCVFMDIQMPEMDGFELLQAMACEAIQVVFVTAHSDYALQAIKANALDYILKPISITALEDAVGRVVKRTNMIQEVQQKETYLQALQNLLAEKRTQVNSSRLTIPTARGFKVLDANDIVRVWADGGYSHIVLSNGHSELVSKNLGYMEEMLSGHHFVRIHYSQLINLDYLMEFSTCDGGMAVMQDGQELLIAKRRLKTFKQRVETYYS